MILDAVNQFAEQEKWAAACGTARVGIANGSDDSEKAACAVRHSQLAWRINGEDFALGNKTAECLATSKEVPFGIRYNARCNLAFYSKCLSVLVPSLRMQKINVPDVPEGFFPHNPSILARKEGGFWCSVRLLNMQYDSGWCGHVPEEDGAITHNMLLLLDDALNVEWHWTIKMPADLPRASFARGAEDIRLFYRGDELWGSATCGFPDNQLRMVLLRFGKQAELLMPCSWKPLHGMFSERMEKNWMPLANGVGNQWIYKVDPTCVISDTQECNAFPVTIAAENWNGSSQAIPFAGGFLCVIHEHETPRDYPTRCSYQHRFVWFDAAMNLRRYSERWWLNSRTFQFVCGMALQGDSLIISYGANGDNEAWLGRMNAEEVWSILKHV